MNRTIQPRRLCAFQPLLFITSFTLALGIVGRSLAAQPAGSKQGTKWTGTVGITETVDQIMARHGRGGGASDKVRPIESHSHRFEEPEDPPLQDNPLAPLVAQWPLPAGPVPL